MRTAIFSARRWFSSSISIQSGHNKWSKIKDRKGANDVKKSNVFAKASRDIAVAVRNGGSANPELNAALATALRKAKASGVPKDNVEKALTRAGGGKGRDAQGSTTYEAMVAGSVGVVIECLTDNATRTSKRMREILGEYNGRLSPVGFLFQRKGLIRVAVEDNEEQFERLWETAVEAGAEDVEKSLEVDGATGVEIIGPPNLLHGITAAVSESGFANHILASELIYRRNPEGAVSEVDEESAQMVGRLVGSLEENEDVLRVWTTVD
ncbi:DUF28-domain-containing protein [Rickenella mellea]|uniref:DUF28-domain-containing protein n=1 Tax=Rickenella mellea TaxID=50990 RepID=A0A4Y7QIH6_9AGAM|nr:DUF28-domain-containing protein [Rickenella mellea]